MASVIRIYLSRFFIISAILLFSHSYSSSAQKLTDNQIKAGIIYSFLKYVFWENETQIDTFKIAVYGDDPSFVEVMKSMEKEQVKNKPIKVYAFNSISEIIYTHVLFITNNRNYLIKDVFDLIKSHNTLLITDRYEFQRYIMINFVYNDNSKIQFEINSKNIEDAKLSTSPKLVLLGGSEIDVRKLYLESEKSLKTEKEKSESFEKELALKKNEIQIMSNRLFQLFQEIQNNKKEIDTLQDKISRQKSELNILLVRAKEQQKNLVLKSVILDKQKEAILYQEKLLADKQQLILVKQLKIEDYGRVLNNQKSEIIKKQALNKELEKSIKEKNEIIAQKDIRIRTQRKFLYLLIALVIMTVAFIFVIYRNYTTKQKKNMELEQMNYELSKSKNEILFQAEQLEHKNIELEKLSIVARETDNAVMIMNGNGEFEWINEGFTRLYGFTLEEFINKRGKSLLEASSYKDIKRVLSTINSEKKTVTYESSNYNCKGDKIWIYTTLTPILYKNKEIKKLIAIDSEITQLKEAELDIINKNEKIQKQSSELLKQAEHLIQLNSELEVKKNTLEEALNKLKNAQSHLVESEKMIILGQLTAGIAHEINNPISFINSGIEGLKMAFNQLIEVLNEYELITPKNIKQKLEEINELKNNINYSTLLSDIHELTKDIKTGIFRTIEIIKELRTFSRLDESDLKLIDLHKNIDSTLVILRNKYINKIEIVKDYGKIPMIECYPGKINQVFLNILVNAIQAIKDEGKIFIKTRQVKKGGQKFLAVTIKDTGKGMTDEVKKKIFEPFFTTKDAGEGTGLGLSISISIIESHHGLIEVESKFGKGSTFSIYLPQVFQKKENNSYTVELTKV
jgi:PAS domain S-box-containing protein